ncbi:MAG: DNA-binding transcriptional ArsR family regulator [Sphingobacteriales bacterium]|jgi:DNA-binding transcriptional ArsR family regulator
MTDFTCIRKDADGNQISRCKNQLISDSEAFDLLANRLHLAGNPVRLKILFLLNQEEQLCVCDMSDILGMQVSAISQHLRKLKDRNLIHTRRDGQTIFYSLAGDYAAMLLPFFTILGQKEKTTAQ